MVELLSGSASVGYAAELDQHVDQCSECRELLINAVRILVPSGTSHTTPAMQGSVPQLFGEKASSVSHRYRILGLIGEGGMGRVYRAMDRLLGIEVALKQLIVGAPSRHLEATGVPKIEGLPSSKLHQRASVWMQSKHQTHDGYARSIPAYTLAAEFHTLCTLRHPNIVRVFDYGFDSQGQPYYTMELLDGAKPVLSLAQELSDREKLELITQLLHAIAYLHRRGVIHRDLTPGNVLVIRTIDGLTVKVVDFGLAQDATLAKQTFVGGTLPYMAPELFRGELASEASDLYSVGMLGYQLLSGRYPFSVSAGPASLLEDILRTEPDLSPLPATLRPMIGQALAKRPASRQRDAATLLRELRTAAQLALEQEPIATRDSYLLAARFVGRHRELQQLQAALSEAERGCGTAWLLRGESGVGKSRLLEELRSRALAAGILTMCGQASPGGGAYHLFRDVLRLLLLQVPLDDLQAGTVATIVPDLSKLIERDIPPTESLDPSSSRLRLFHVVEELLAQLPHTALLLLDDVQWADAESLALLSHLANDAAKRSLLVVAAARDDEGLDLATALPTITTMHLQRFGRSEMAELCASMLGMAGRDDGLLDLVAAQTEGNAYFIVEVMRALAAESGSLSSIGHDGLPQTVCAGGMDRVLNRRLARAPDSAVPLLHLSALIGRDLDLSLLSKLIPDTEQHVQAIADVGLVELFGQRWRFSHDKLRERVLDTLCKEVRQPLHHRIAEAMEQLYAQESSRAAQIAIHYRDACEPAKAAHFYLLASDTALRQGAPKEAALLLEQAKTLHDQLPVSRLASVRLWRGLTESHFGLDRLRESEEALRTLCELCETPLPTESLSLLSMTGRLAAELLGHRLGLWKQRTLRGPEQIAISTELLAGLVVLRHPPAELASGG